VKGRGRTCRSRGRTQGTSTRKCSAAAANTGTCDRSPRCFCSWRPGKSPHIAAPLRGQTPPCKTVNQRAAAIELGFGGYIGEGWRHKYHCTRMTIDDVREVRFRRLLCTVSRANCAMLLDMSRTAAGGRWNWRRRGQLAAENHALEMRGWRLLAARGGAVF
jgi:hypothetical protein